MYWSGMEYAAYSGTAWLFFLNYGYRQVNFEVARYYALAIRPGDVAATVPEPATLLLMGSGLVGLLLCRRRLRRSRIASAPRTRALFEAARSTGMPESPRLPPDPQSMAAVFVSPCYRGVTGLVPEYTQTVPGRPRCLQ